MAFCWEFGEHERCGAPDMEELDRAQAASTHVLNK